MTKKSSTTAALMAVLALSGLYFGGTETAEAGECRLKVRSRATDDIISEYCRTQADTTSPDMNAEVGDPGWIPYFFENPDSCDLGLNFPGLPDFGIDISKINSCQILKAVSENAVNQVNEKFSELEDGIDEAVGDGEIDLDLNEDVQTRID